MIQVLDLAGKNNSLCVVDKNFVAAWIDVRRIPELLNVKVECIWIRQNVLVGHACDDTECL